METFTLSRKELLRAGLIRAALAGEITNRQGAAALRLTIRQFQRLKQRMRAAGAADLRHRGRGRPSPRRLKAAVRQRVVTLLQTRYAGFNDTHLTEKLQEEHGLRLSRESVRRLRQSAGLDPVRTRRAPRHRRRRAREAAMGALVQIDASPFAWLEDRGPRLTLHGAIDDATSTVCALHFRPAEDLHGYATVLAQMLATYGVPLALYGDGINILVRNDRHWTVAEHLAGHQTPTHLGRVLQELGIGYIQARSPQAKGRIERLWQTLQDRLVSELRLHRIASVEAAHAFLPRFLAAFNRRFARPPAAAAGVWRRPPRDLALVVSCRYTRVVARDNTVRLGPRWIQLPRGAQGRSWAGRRVEVRELLDGQLVVRAAGTVVARAAARPGPFALVPRHGPSAERRPRRSPDAHPAVRAALRELAAALTPPPGPRPHRPSPRHPWRVAVQHATRLTHPVRG